MNRNILKLAILAFTLLTFNVYAETYDVDYDSDYAIPTIPNVLKSGDGINLKFGDEYIDAGLTAYSGTQIFVNKAFAAGIACNNIAERLIFHKQRLYNIPALFIFRSMSCRDEQLRGKKLRVFFYFSCCVESACITGEIIVFIQNDRCIEYSKLRQIFGKHRYERTAVMNRKKLAFKIIDYSSCLAAFVPLPRRKPVLRLKNNYNCGTDYFVDIFHRQTVRLLQNFYGFEQHVHIAVFSEIKRKPLAEP